jgi:hypothetical protein
LGPPVETPNNPPKAFRSGTPVPKSVDYHTLGSKQPNMEVSPHPPGVDQNGPRPMFKLPFNAPLTVIPFQNSLEETFGFRQTDSKLLGGHFIPGFGQLYFSLYCDDEGFFTQRGKPNQHIPGLFGDAFVGAHFASDREIDDTPSGNWWDTHNERTAFGYPIPEQRMNTLLEELRFKVLVMFNPLKKLKDDFTMQLVHRTMREDHRSMFIRTYIMPLESNFQHPEGEVFTIAADRLSPKHDEWVPKTFGALIAYMDRLCHEYNYGYKYRMHVCGGDICFRSAELPDHLKNLSLMNLFCDRDGKPAVAEWIRLQRAYIASVCSASQPPAGHPPGKADKNGMTDHQKAFWANYEAENAEMRAQEARRKLRAVDERGRRAADAARQVASHTSFRKESQKREKVEARRKTREQRLKEEQARLEHEVHDTDTRREISTERFNAKQELEHAEKMAREARELADRLKQLAVQASASAAAATHVVPAPPTLGSVLERAMGSSSSEA